jgi:hypothetical protein
MPIEILTVTLVLVVALGASPSRTTEPTDPRWRQMAFENGPMNDLAQAGVLPAMTISVT